VALINMSFNVRPWSI